MTVLYWVSEYLFCLFECINGCLFSEGLLSDKRKKNGFIIYFLVSIPFSAFMIALNRVDLFSSINTFLFFIAFFLFGVYYFKSGVSKTLIVELLYFLLVFLFDIIISSIVADIKDISVFDIFNSMSDGRIIVGFSSKISLTIACIATYKLKSSKHILDKKILFLLFCGTVTLIIISALLYFEIGKDKDLSLITMSLFMFMFALIAVSYIAVINIYESQLEKKKIV